MQQLDQFDQTLPLLASKLTALKPFCHFFCSLLCFRPMNKIRFALSAILLLIPIYTLFATMTVQAQSEGDAFSQLSPAAQTVAMSINQMRAQAGLPPLAINGMLNYAAQAHVDDMVNNQNYSHTGSDGSNVRQRVQRTGYGNAWASENWVSVNDPSTAIQWWMNSTIHRNNILNGNWHELGVGASGYTGNGQMIFVAVFAGGGNGDSVMVMPPPPAAPPIPAGGIQYTVQTGDTLLSIGLRYGIEWPMIAGANGLNEFSLLQIGQTLRIPGVDEENAQEPIRAAVKEEPPTVNDDGTFVRRYTVQPGDTIVGIAAIYKLDWQDVASENGLGEFSVISVGQELRIPGVVKGPPPANTGGPTTAEEEIPAEYTVAPGDTIISIAIEYDLDWEELMQINNLTESSVLSLGQKLRLR